MRKPTKGYRVEVIFDDEDAAQSFFASWLDGGLDGGGNLDWDTSAWDTKRHSWMRIKGTGSRIIWEGGKMIVLTPEVEAQRMKAAMQKYATTPAPKREGEG